MKAFLCLALLVGMACVPVAAVDAPREWGELKVAGGKVYKDVKLIKADDEALRVSHATGVARIPYEYLPVEMQEEFGFDPVKAKAARKEQAAAWKAEKETVRATLKAQQDAAVDYASIEWVGVNVKVVRVVPGGIICHRYQPGGAAGETARAIHDLVDNPKRFRPPEQSKSVEATATTTLWFLEGVKGEFAEGEVLVGKAGRYGVKQWEGRSLQRWIAKPE